MYKRYRLSYTGHARTSTRAHYYGDLEIEALQSMRVAINYVHEIQIQTTHLCTSLALAFHDSYQPLIVFRMVSDIRQNRIPVTEHAQFPLRSGPYLVYMIMDGAIAGAYDLEETLGKGRFAVVRSARHVFTGERVAVKVIDKTKLDEISRDHLYKEVNCLKLVQHPNIVRLYEVIDTLTKLYLILELGDGGDLYDVILKKGRLKEEDAKTYFRQVLLAVEYCHKLHVVHRDLKPDNIIFFSEWPHVRLTDFGLSNIFRPGEKLSTSCGSMNYTAPEILRGDNYDGPAGGTTHTCV